MKRSDEENPALGWRAVRIGLDRPALLRMQMRAMLRAAEGRASRDAADGLDGRRNSCGPCAARSRDWILSNFGRDAPRSIELGAMVEVPSLLWQLDEIARGRIFSRSARTT